MKEREGKGENSPSSYGLCFALGVFCKHFIRNFYFSDLNLSFGMYIMQSWLMVTRRLCLTLDQRECVQFRTQSVAECQDSGLGSMTLESECCGERQERPSVHHQSQEPCQCCQWQQRSHQHQDIRICGAENNHEISTQMMKHDMS